MSCAHEHEDGAYVLGALSPEDRAAFEAHLPDCAECVRAVGELAGLPGLLSRVPADRLDPAPDAVPETLLLGLVARVRTQRRRRRLLAAGLAAAAVVVVGVSVDRTAHPGSSPASVVADGAVGGSIAPPVAMHSLGDDPVSATISLTAVGYGTRVELTCDERADRPSAADPTAVSKQWSSYAMYVHTRDGRSERVATWKAMPGGIVHVSGVTATDRSDIVDVDVRNAGGIRVLDLG